MGKMKETIGTANMADVGLGTLTYALQYKRTGYHCAPDLAVEAAYINELALQACDHTLYKEVIAELLLDHARCRMQAEEVIQELKDIISGSHS